MEVFTLHDNIEESVNDAVVVAEERSYYPAIRDHSYFKGALSRSGFSREHAIKAYNVVMKEIRSSILLGYQVDINPLIDFIPYLKLVNGKYLPHVKAVLHQAVQHPDEIFYAKSVDNRVVSDPDWDMESVAEIKNPSSPLDGTTEIDYSHMGNTDGIIEVTAEGKKPNRMNAFRIEGDIFYHPAIRDHKYFKAALYRSGFTKEQSSRAYNLIMREIRNSIQAGYQVRLDSLIEFIPYLRRKPSGFVPSVKADLHKTVRSTTTIRYAISLESRVIHDPDWE
jgi:nucleoid DNA-binding protein